MVAFFFVNDVEAHRFTRNRKKVQLDPARIGQIRGPLCVRCGETYDDAGTLPCTSGEVVAVQPALRPLREGCSHDWIVHTDDPLLREVCVHCFGHRMPDDVCRRCGHSRGEHGALHPVCNRVECGCTEFTDIAVA